MSAFIAGCQYMPSIEFYVHWYHHLQLILEAHEHYQKRSWRNRTAILGKTEPLYLSVPLRKGKNQQRPIREVEIAYDEPWHKNHFSAIETAYGKSAFFNEIAPDLRNILFAKHAHLWDLNLEMIRLFANLISATLSFEVTHMYQPVYDHMTDMRAGIPSGISSIDPSEIPQYVQVQRIHQSHLPNLSILDAICHLGPGLTDYLNQYDKKLYPEKA